MSDNKWKDSWVSSSFFRRMFKVLYIDRKQPKPNPMAWAEGLGKDIHRDLRKAERTGKFPNVY